MLDPATLGRQLLIAIALVVLFLVGLGVYAIWRAFNPRE